MRPCAPPLAAIVFAWLAATTLAANAPADPLEPDPPASAKDFFVTDRVWTIHLRVSAEGWKALPPTRPPGALARLLGAGRPAATRPAATQPVDERFAEEGKRLAANPFGYQFAYVRGTVEVGGRTMRDAALRLKGNSSYWASARADGGKHPFKIDFNRFDEELEFLGLSKLNLHNHAFDPSQVREALSYELFRRSGVPAPRTAYALVYVTVDGQFERRCLGLYTVIEEVNRDFLKRHFGTKKGLLAKPEVMRGLPHLGDDPAAYARPYDLKGDPEPADVARLVALARLVNRADKAAFEKEAADFIDLDAFARFMAVNVLLSNLDSLLCTGHNFYLYLHPETRRFHFFPWDLNLSFGAFDWVGDPAEQAALSLDKPFVAPNAFLDRVTALEAFQAPYRRYLRELTRPGGPFDAAAVRARVDELAKVVERAEAQARAQAQAQAQARAEGGGASPPPPPPEPAGMNLIQHVPDLKPFITARLASVEAQLAGKAKGYVPVFRTGRMFGGDAPRRLANQVAKAVMAAGDGDGDGRLSSAEAERALERLIAEAGGRGGGDDAAAAGTAMDAKALAGAVDRLMSGAAEGQRGRAAGPGVAPAVVRVADADGDARVTAAELRRALAGRFKAADAGGDGMLDLAELVQGMAEVLTPTASNGRR